MSNAEHHHSTAETDATQNPTATNGSNLRDKLGVSISLLLAQQQLTLAELEDIQPGYVFALDQTPEQLKVALLANGQTLGWGELVMIGDQLGLQVMELV